MSPPPGGGKTPQSGVGRSLRAQKKNTYFVARATR